MCIQPHELRPEAYTALASNHLITNTENSSKKFQRYSFDGSNNTSK